MHAKDRLRLLRRLVKGAIGRDVTHRPDVSIPSERFGSEYGGWAVITEALSEESVVYSFGVGEDASFDLELIDGYGLTVHAFDPTPRAVEWVASNPMPRGFRFHQVGIADRDGTATFNAPNNPRHASYTLSENEGDPTRAVTSQVRRLSSIMSDLGHDHVDVLKLDIEGAEYPVIHDIMRSEIVIGQLLVEFHHAFKTISIDRTNQSVDLLRRNGFLLFNISPRGEEYSFIHDNHLQAVSPIVH